MAKELILSVTKKDLIIETFRSGGSGGQHQNKTDSGVRIIHKESGAIGESRDDRSQGINKKIAFNRLVNSSRFKIWLNRRLYEINQQKTIEEMIDEQLKDSLIKTEVKVNNKWEEVKLADLN